MEEGNEDNQFQSRVRNIKKNKPLGIEEEEYVELKKGISQLIGLTLNNDVSTVFFLDKSARPISWLFSGVWRTLQKEGRLDQKCPEVRFINVGWSNRFPTIGKDKIKIPKDGNIMLVDETMVTGNTLLWGMTFLRDLFPDRRIIAHGMGPTTFSWYTKKARTGVTDRDKDFVFVRPALTMESRNFRKKMEWDAIKIADDISGNFKKITDMYKKPYLEGSAVEAIKSLEKPMKKRS